MNDFTIRLADVCDAEAIRKISSEDLGYPTCERKMVEDRIRQLAPEREAVFAAEAEGQVVGYIHVEKYEVLYFEAAANILALAVAAGYRGRGIGKRLLAAAEAWAAGHGIRYMRLNSSAERKAAHAFYRHLGYDAEKEQIRFMKRLF